jgi:uncharacterized membrane protein YagU involved in acid resistance
MRFSATSPSHGVVWKGLLAGLAGGLAASWVMNQFQAVVPADTFQRLLGESSDSDSAGDQEAPEPATVQAAEALSEGVLNHELTKREKKTAGPAVHYAFGTTVGGAYGAVAEVAPSVTIGGGLPFGTVFWLVADEAAVPALGLSDPPTEHPPSTHLYALTSHLVYGLTADLVRRAVRALL